MTKTHTDEFDTDKQQIAACYAGQLAVQLVSGNREALHTLVDDCFDAMERGECPEPMDLTLWELGIDTRMIGYLDFESDPNSTHKSVLNVRQLVAWSAEDLLSLPNVGTKMLKDVVRQLERLGLTLAEPVGVG